MIDEKKLLENVVEMFHCVPLISNGKREEYFDDILERQPKIEQPQLNQWHVVADGELRAWTLNEDSDIAKEKVAEIKASQPQVVETVI